MLFHEKWSSVLCNTEIKLTHFPFLPDHAATLWNLPSSAARGKILHCTSNDLRLIKHDVTYDLASSVYNVFNHDG